MAEGRVLLGDAVVAGDRVESFTPAADVDHLGEEGAGYGPATYDLELCDEG